jgi:hypothetical protein
LKLKGRIMFTISNTRKVGDNSFITAKGRPVILKPGRVLNFDDEELSDGLLRTMIGERSVYKVLADGDDAQKMISSRRKADPLPLKLSWIKRTICPGPISWRRPPPFWATSFRRAQDERASRTRSPPS